MRRADLQNLSQAKLNSASALYGCEQFSDAYYLAGYAVEFALKACVAKFISADTIPDKSLLQKVYTHDINTLRGLAGLKSDFDIKARASSTFAAYWGICSEWSPDARYKDWSAAEANHILLAITNKEHGVLPWIKNFW